MVFLPTSMRPAPILDGARPANGTSARVHSARGGPPFPSMATPSRWPASTAAWICGNIFDVADSLGAEAAVEARSEEHTSELQSHLNLVCRLLLEKKKNTIDENDYRMFHLLSDKNRI